MIINPTGIYVLWLRELKRFFRSKSRIVGTTATPLFFLAFLGMGLGNLIDLGGVDYFSFLVPGIIGMNLLFSSTFGGLSVLADREFGFLKEIMVSPVNRTSIVLGRIAGGVTTSIIQALIILFISMLMGFRVPGILPFLSMIVFMLMISFTFLGLGLVFASRLKDVQGFQLIVNFIIFPMFLLSGVFFPVTNFPGIIKLVSFIDPLTYGVDGMRGVLLGSSLFSPFLNFIVLAGFGLFMVILGAYLFDKSDSV